MTSFSGLGIGLSLVFGCLFLALVGELYYLLWWKKKKSISLSQTQIGDSDFIHSFKDFNHMFFCCKNPSSSLQPKIQKDPDTQMPDPDLEIGSSNDPVMKTVGEEGVEADELMRLHNLSGPPRFLFTIREETREELESDDGKSKGDVSFNMDMSVATTNMTTTPLVSPLASPKVKSPTLELEQDGFNFNPLFESSTELGFNRLRSSPPPKFQFLRDAEEKLWRKLKEKQGKEAEEEERKGGVEKENCWFEGSTMEKREMIEGSFLKFMVGKSREPLLYLPPPQYSSSSAQILPLASSPTAFRHQ